METCQTILWPYRIVDLTPNNAEVRLIDKPEDPTDHFCCRFKQSAIMLSWSGKTRKRAQKKSRSSKDLDGTAQEQDVTLLSNTAKRAVILQAVIL